MPIDLRPTAPFILSDDTIKAMLDALEASRQDGLERGFDLCEDWESARLEPGAKCLGSKCGIVVRDCTTQGLKKAGNFHTHPEAKSEPSPGDLLSMMYEALISWSGDSIGCRMGTEDRSLTCDYISKVDRAFYDTHIKLYKKYVEPFYEEWGRTGEPPFVTPQYQEAYNQISWAAAPKFHSRTIYEEDMVRSITELTERIGKITEPLEKRGAAL